MILYHGTPYQFTILNRCSWLATSPEEAAAHLILKNASSDGEDYLSGYILEIEIDDEKLTSSDFYYYSDPGHYLSLITHQVKKSTLLRDMIDSFQGPLKHLNNLREVIDLAPLFKGE